MSPLIIAKGSALAILEPFLADLVAADVKVPYLGGHALKVLGFVDIDAVLGLAVSDLFHHVGAGHIESLEALEAILRGVMAFFSHICTSEPLPEGYRQRAWGYGDER